MQRDRAGRLLLEIYAEDGVSHRDPKAGPALYSFADGCECFEYQTRGVLHREEQDGPAFTLRHEASGAVLREEYYRDGALHREHGPAAVERDEKGRTISQAWYREGELHRDAAEGPALITFDPDTGDTSEDYWCDGVWAGPADDDGGEALTDA